ncbi:MAG: hypothetical protein RLZZ546_1164 [Bacteroidota bacterium]|jgi:hypothetical protein
MGFFKSPTFKYVKNLLIGLGAAVVMIGALGKINSYSWGGPAITAGLVVEAILFALLGILGPEPDYYWEKLYPGLDSYTSKISPLTDGPVKEGPKALDGEAANRNLSGMLNELQNMSKSLGSLKALQEVDFTQTGDQMKTMNNFYAKMSDAMKNLSDGIEDTKTYKDQIVTLNKNLSSLNSVYGNVLNAMGANNK